MVLILERWVSQKIEREGERLSKLRACFFFGIVMRLLEWLLFALLLHANYASALYINYL